MVGEGLDNFAPELEELGLGAKREDTSSLAVTRSTEKILSLGPE